MSVIEKVGMFLYTLALGTLNREVYERFQHSKKYSIVFIFQYIVKYDVYLECGRKCGEFCRICLHFLTKHKFKL